jgi:hypothetical protein
MKKRFILIFWVTERILGDSSRGRKEQHAIERPLCQWRGLSFLIWQSVEMVVAARENKGANRFLLTEMVGFAISAVTRLILILMTAI